MAGAQKRGAFFRETSEERPALVVVIFLAHYYLGGLSPHADKIDARGEGDAGRPGRADC